MPSALETESVKASSRPQRERLSPDSLILSGVVALLLFGPLAFGATQPWSIFLLEFVSALLLGLWVWKQLSAESWTVRDNPLFRPAAVLAAVALLQLIFNWTAYRHETYSQALLYCAYAALAFLVTQTLRHSSQAKTLALVVTGYGLLLAAFALLQGLAPNGKIYWLYSPTFHGWIYGPYVNHNHYAGLMEMLVPVPLVFCLTRYARGKLRTLIAGTAALMAGTIFLSGSRGGMVALLAELAVLGWMLFRTQKALKLAAIGAFAIGTLALLVWIGGAQLTRRIELFGSEARHELDGGVRWTIDKDSLRMFSRKPVLGWGLGTFPSVYPQFRSFYTSFFINEAHNDYLQILVETGVVGFAAVVWFLVLLYRHAFRKLPGWPDHLNGAVALAAMLGCTGIVVHSLVDFNLQVPANAAWFYVLAVVAASSYPLESRQRIRRVRSHNHDVFDPEAPAHSQVSDTQ
jgi:O-antigen ligase